MSTLCRSYALPQEITGLMLQSLSGDTATLSAASLVCKDWLVESSRVLFEVLRIDLDKTHDTEWLQFLKKTPRVHSNVRALRLVPRATSILRQHQGHPFQYLLQTMLCLPKLESLDLSCANLALGPGEDAALIELRSKELVLKRLKIKDIPIPNPISMTSTYCYMRLLSAVHTVEDLRIISHDKWPVLKNLAALRVRELAHMRPVCAKNVTVWCLTDFPFMSWMCGAMYPTQGHPIDRDHLESLDVVLWPTSGLHDSSIPPIINLVSSRTHLQSLDLHISFTNWAIRGPDELDEFAVSLRQLDLPSHRHLKSLSIKSLPTSSMDKVSTATKESLRTLWKDLMSTLDTAPSSLQTLEISFIRDTNLLPFSSLYFMQGEFGRTIHSHDFLHDGRPASVAHQVYDWTLLRRFVAEHKGLESVIFRIIRKFDGDEEDKGCLWSKYPKTVRILKDIVPRVSVEFNTV